MLSRRFVFSRLPLYRISKQKSGLNNYSKPLPSWLEIRPNVLTSINTGKPVVAFETAIVTHGLPKPINLDLNFDIRKICMEVGVVPASIGFVHGKLIIGLDDSELKFLACGDPKIEKIARLDAAKALSQNLSGGTTVSSTMWAASLAGIRVFVTGGIGGVHRGWQESLDISSDLTELSRTPVAVVCAGCKSILDIPATIEYLETLGVPVATFHKEGYFPAFHSPSSDVKVPLKIRSYKEAANLIDAHFSTSQHPSGILIACPIPEDCGISVEDMEARITKALKKASKLKVTGKASTPFLLEELANYSKGETVNANIELVLNNTRIGCHIAKELAKSSSVSYSAAKPSEDLEHDRPVIVGGSVLDAYGKFSESDVAHTKATEKGRVFLSSGGVGRNVADCMARVMGIKETEKRPLLVSVLSNDSVGHMIVSLTSENLDVSGIKWLDHKSTGLYSPSYVGTLANTGQYLVGIGDFAAMEEFNSNDLIAHNENIAKAPLVVIDGNLKADIFPQLMSVCLKNCVPLYYECTDIYKATRIFTEAVEGQNIRRDEVTLFDCLALLSPNMTEFLQLARLFLDKTVAEKCEAAFSSKSVANDEYFKDIVKVGRQLVFHPNCAPNLLLKLGSNGIIVMRRGKADSPLPMKKWKKSKPCESDEFSAVWYDAEPPGQPPEIESVSGAGDCLIGTIIGQTLKKQVNLDLAIRAGIRAAYLSLESETAVPKTISPEYLASAECLEWMWKLPRKDITELAN